LTPRFLHDIVSLAALPNISREAKGGILCLYQNDSSESRPTFPTHRVSANSRHRVYSSRTIRELGICEDQVRPCGLRLELPEREQLDIVQFSPNRWIGFQATAWEPRKQTPSYECASDVPSNLGSEKRRLMWQN
jgi:hypothetical protein